MSLLSNFSWIKSVDQSIKDTVSGYIRHSQQLLPADNAYFNIPPSIEYMVLKYYWLQEFFAEIDQHNVQVGDDGDTVTRSYIGQIKQRYSSAYGKVMVESDKELIYEWQVKILKLNENTKRHYTYRLGIGLCSDNTLTKYCFMDTVHNAKGFLVWESGQIEQSATLESQYQEFEEKDIVKIIVNTKRQKCTVYINDEDEREIELSWNNNYHFAVCFGKSSIDIEEGISVKLTHFDCKQA